MELNIDHERIVANPDAATIRRELSALRDQQFAILSKDEFTFIQTLVDSDAGIILEHQEGSLHEHFAAAQPPRTIEHVIAAFVSYAHGTDVWRRAFEWVPMVLTQADYTVVVMAATDAFDQIGNPLEWEVRLELPDIGVGNLIALYALLSNKSPASLEPQFTVVAETQPEGLDGVLVIKAPDGFQKTLAKLAPAAIGVLAARWQATDHFPSAEYDEAAAMAAVTELAAMARSALDSRRTLLLCALQ